HLVASIDIDTGGAVAQGFQFYGHDDGRIVAGAQSSRAGIRDSGFGIRDWESRDWGQGSGEATIAARECAPVGQLNGAAAVDVPNPESPILNPGFPSRHALCRLQAH